MLIHTVFRITGITLFLFCVSIQAAETSTQFVRHEINAMATFDSCAVFDVNNDGKPDIVSGGSWYEAPGWKPHFLREVEQIRGRFDDYSSLPLDVNGDGYPDLVSANYRSASLYWVQNPGPAGLSETMPWQRHVIAEPGSMETGRLFDVDGDGQMDVLPNGIKFASWWSVKSGSDPVWSRHALPEQLAGHGIGAGDINGDGRTDIVGNAGWAEAPEDRRNGRWVFHDEFRTERDAGLPMLVYDVDGDSDRDIVWGRGHRVGLYWLEQVTEGSATRKWIRHAIDTSWSQAHSLLLADLNGDGRDDLIAGKRFLGHDGKDPGEFDPLVSYWYEFIPETRTWKRHLIHRGGNVGFGLDPKTVDLDQDGDLDLIVADRCGLNWLENRGASLGGSSEPAEPAEHVDAAESADALPYSNHQDVMVFSDGTGNLLPVATPFQMAIRRQHILDGMLRAMGKMPSSDRRVPLNITVETEEDTEKYVRRKISYSPESADRVPAWLLIPKGIEGRMPAMLCLHQTTKIGKGEPAGLGGLPNLHYAHELAERGFVCLVPDYPSFGDYPYDFKVQGAAYGSGSMKAIWNNIRAVDLLETLPEVDSDRIGCIGHSLGGHNTLFTAAFDVRIRAAVTSCGFTAFHHYYKGDLIGWTSDRYMPRIRDVYSSDPDQVPFDFYEVLAAIAPRAIFINAPVGDDNFENQGVRKVVTETEKIFAVYGDSDERLIARYPECRHDFPADIREECYQWLQKQLK